LASTPPFPTPSASIGEVNLQNIGDIVPVDLGHYSGRRFTTAQGVEIVLSVPDQFSVPTPEVNTANDKVEDRPIAVITNYDLRPGSLADVFHPRWGRIACNCRLYQDKSRLVSFRIAPFDALSPPLVRGEIQSAESGEGANALKPFRKISPVDVQVVIL
jgi:hypothetical protein